MRKCVHYNININDIITFTSAVHVAFNAALNVIHANPAMLDDALCLISFFQRNSNLFQIVFQIVNQNELVLNKYESTEILSHFQFLF